MRNAFFEGGLNMCACSNERMEEQLLFLEHALDFLHTPNPELVPTSDIRPLFETEAHWKHYAFFLCSVGLAWHGKHPLDTLQISDEGRAVLLMLRMTSAATRGKTRALREKGREARATMLPPPDLGEDA